MSKSSLKSAGSKGAGSKSLRPNRLYAAVLLALSGQAMALPEGGQVVAGDAAISVSGDTMQILQNSQRAILNFQSFDIASQQTVNFQQPGADAVALNRVLGDRLSEIHGALNANGQIYLINPNGVLFGNGAEINVGSLVVTTLDIADQDFLAGRDAFSGAATGRIENHGRIDADGRVVLLAPEVINSGDINVPNGDIVMQSSRQALLHTPGSDIPILVEDTDLIGRVVNEGTLSAGEVALILHSDKAQLAYDAAINNSGLIRAVRATGEGGEIHLLSGAGILNSGTLDASADTGAGGEITLTAEAINQSGQITAKAAGTGDGGTITLLADNAIAMHSGSTIDASADQVGDAGDVVVIAEKATWFTGDASIKARGGEQSGDGGFVEVSGLEFISIDGAVNVGADNGNSGLWFIDPTDIEINPGNNVGGGFNNSDPNTWTAQPGTSTAGISLATLFNTIDNDGNVKIVTTSNGTGTGTITFNTVLDINNLGTQNAGRVNTLELVADNQIIFTVNGGIWDSAPGGDGVNLNFTAGNGFRINEAGAQPDGRGVVNSGLGKINIVVEDGDALVTGLASAATGLDAIKLDVQNGAIIENGNSLWDVMLLTNGGGVTLKAQSGISGLSIRNNEGGVSLLDASTATGDISGVRAAGDLEISRLVVGSTSSAAVSAEGQLKIGSGAQLIGKSFDFESDTLIVIPNGFTTAGTLRLDAPDITDLTSSRTLNFGADHLIIDTEATGGNLTINSTVNTLSVTNRSTNTIIVDDTDDLILGTIEPLVGAIMVSSGSGTDLTVGEDINLTSMNGALTLNAGRDLLVNAAILDGAAITLTAPRNVLFSADGAVDAGSGNIGITATSGNVALGALTGGAITVNAGGSITDANGSDVNLSATSAILSAGTGSIGALADGLETSVGTLTLNSANGSAFISNSQALNLTSVNVGDDLNVSLPTAGNLTLNQSTPTIGGTATFSVANGQLIVPNTGWTTTGNLTVSATRIVDSNSSATVSLTANNADLTLTGAVASTLNVNFNTLALQLSGGSSQTVQVADANALSISNLSSNGNLTINTANGSDLTITDTTPVSSGQLTLNSGGNLVLTTGLNVAGNLTILADDLRDSDADVTLTADTANITLRNGGAQARDWATTFDELVLDITGTGDFNLTNAGALILTSVNTDGNASFTTSSGDLTLSAGSIDGNAAFSAAGDLVMTSAPTITGDLSLTTGNGDVIVSDGLSVGGDLTVDADDLRDIDGGDLTLVADNANITLRDTGAQARAWTTTFDELALNIAGTGDFSLTNTDTLILSSITTGGNTSIATLSGGLTLGPGSIGGNAAFTAADGDLEFINAPTFSGDLSLTANSGAVIVDDASLIVSGDLTINAEDLRDSDADLTLEAATANITLSAAGAQARTWTTIFDELVLDITGTGDFNLTNAGALTLTSVTTGGNASFSTNGDLTLGAGSVGGNAAFTATAGDVIVSDTLTVGGNLTVDADDLRDVDGGVLTLAATNANITLRDAGPQAHNWTTTFGQLELAIDGIGDFSLTNSGALNLISVVNGGNTTITTDVGGLSIGTASVGGDAVFTGAGDLTMGSVSAGGNAEFTSTTGDITFGTGTIDGDTVFNATAGNVEVTGAQTFGGNLSLNTGDVILSGDSLVAGGDLTIEADDLRGAAADLTLSAANADITLRNGSAQNWATDFNQLALDIGGAGDFELTNTGALTLTSVNTEGNASFTTSNGSLTLGGGSIGGEAAFTATNGDVVMTSAPTVTGDLSLTTVGSGDVIVSDGLSVGGNLTVDADDLRDVDAGVLTLAATNANIILRDTGAQGRNWSTTFADLVLSLTGTGDFSLNNTGALALSLTTTGGTASFTSNGDLTLNAGDIGGSAALTANNGNVELVTAPSVTGNLSLTTVGTGDVILSEDGLTIGGDLTVDADDLRDSDADVILTAATANITLRNEDTQARDWTTTFEELVLDIAGTGDFNLTNTGDLTVTSATTGGSATFATEGGSLTMGTGAIGGDASFSATDGDLVFTSAPTVMGDLTLTTTGTGAVIVSDNGLIVGGVLTVDADDLRDGDADLTLTLTATSADITLRNTGSQARNWTTSFNELVLDIAGDGDFLLTNSSALDLISVTTGGNATFATNGGRLSVDSGDIGGDASFHAMDADLIFTGAPTVRGGLSLTTTGSGDIVLPTAGLLHDGALTIEADNLVADDIILGATDATITLRGGDLAQSWNTRFDTLALTIDGGGDFALEDTDGLTLTSVNTGGNTSFSTNNADLVLEGNPVVAGELSLLTVGGGDVVLPNAGLLHNGDLRIVADDLVGDSGPLIMSAANAIITLHGGDAAQTWNTSFDRLALNIAGTGDFSLTDTDGLILTSVNTGGNASFRTTAANLVLSTAPVVAGALHLETIDSGDLVLPTAGLAHNGKLTLVADRVRDNNTDISLSATELTAELRDHQQAAIWNTDVDRLDLTVAGGGALTLNNTGTLVIDNLVSDGQVSADVSGNLTIGTLQGAADMAFSSDANLTLLNTTYDVDGELALTAANDLRLASGGLTVTDTMRLVAAQLTVAGGTPVVLAGTAADLTLTGTQALALTTRLGQLGLTYGGNSVSINNDRNLTINRWTAANADTVGLSVAGTLTLPAAGLAARERLTIDAVDLRERSLSLSAPELAVRLSGASGNHNWTVNADSLDVLMRGQANLQVNAANGLVLEDLNGDNNAVLVENGNFTLNLASGDLTLANTVSAADLTADGVRAGIIDLAVAQGSVHTRGAAILISTNLVDQDASGDAIRIRLADTSASDRNITLGDSSNSAVTLRAIGGDILLDSRAASTAEAAKRNVVQHSGVGIEAFDNPGDNLSGRVLINGEQVAAQPWQTVRTGRTLAIVTDVAPPPPPAGSVIDELDDLDDGSTEIIRDSDKSGPKAAAQFEQVFGTCDELDKKNRHRCRVDDALKSFLSHWLVGGELPPKTEIR